MADVMPQIGEEALNARHSPAAPASLFDSDAWFDRLHAGCFAGQAAVTLDGEAGDARCRLRLVSQAPGSLAALANWYSFRWLPQWTGGGEGSRAAALQAAFEHARARAHRLALSPIPVAGGHADLIRGALRRAGWTVGSTIVSRSHWLDVEGRSFASWWATRPGQLRSTVQRKGKKGVVQCVIHRSFADAVWNAFCDVYAASWKGAESHPEFLRSWTRDAAAEGALRLGIASIDGRAVAGQFWTFDGSNAHIHKLAHIRDPAIDSYSPGTLLSHAMFAEAFDADHAARIDFGTGDDPYKRDWMEQSTDLVALVAVDLRRPKGWISLARHGFTRVAGRLHKG